MDELIKRSDALQAIAQLALPYHIQRERILDALQKIPAADAVEVVHGKWIVDKERLTAACSECGKELRFSDELQIYLFEGNERFCYYCGAKMDGERAAHE